MSAARTATASWAGCMSSPPRKASATRRAGSSWRGRWWGRAKASSMFPLTTHESARVAATKLSLLHTTVFPLCMDSVPFVIRATPKRCQKLVPCGTSSGHFSHSFKHLWIFSTMGNDTIASLPTQSCLQRQCCRLWHSQNVLVWCNFGCCQKEESVLLPCRDSDRLCRGLNGHQWQLRQSSQGKRVFCCNIFLFHKWWLWHYTRNYLK